MSIIIGIDHGYYAIKTAHCSFPAGLTSYGEHEPYTRQGLLEFGGCFFVCGSGRQPILFIRGERPVIDLKYNLLKHPNIRCTEDGGAAPYDYTAADNALDDLPGAPENYELLDMDDFLPAEAAEMKPTIQRIRRPK